MNPFAIFRKPSARTLAQVELEEARRRLLIAQTGLDYARAMVQYEATRVQRLEGFLVMGRGE